MKQWFTSMLFAALAVSLCAGLESSPAAHPGQAPAQSSAAPATAGQVQGFFTMELTKSVDSKKLKDGDEVDASW